MASKDEWKQGEAPHGLPATTPVAEPALRAATTGRLLYLESIRGLAAFFVVISHLADSFWPILKADYAMLVAHSFMVRLLAASPLSVFHDGNFSVRLFFVLSGFVLSLSYFKTGDRNVVSSAAVRRYFRLMIPACASVLLAWLLLRLGWFYNLRAAILMEQKPGAWLMLFFNFKMSAAEALQQGIYGTFFHYDETRTLNSSLWTMPVELAGSFLVFALLALAGSLRRRGLIYGVLILLLHFAGERTYLYVDFVCGVMICDAFIHVRPDRLHHPLSGPVAGLLLLAGLALGGLKPDWLRAHTGTYGHLMVYWQTVGAMMVILSALTSPRLQRMLELSPVALLGRLSFPLYLVHVSVICSLGCRTYMQARAWGLIDATSTIVAATVSVAASLVAAWLLYYATDLPAIRLGKWIDRQVFRPGQSR